MRGIACLNGITQTPWKTEQPSGKNDGMQAHKKAGRRRLI
jgi:hypothetical protein